jgi:hypothetical protein
VTITVTVILINGISAIAPISTIDVVVLPVVAKSNLGFGAMTALAIQNLAEPSAELLQSFPEEMLADTIRPLAFDCPAELFLLKDSLEKGCGGLNGLIVENFTAQNKLLVIVLVVRHIVQLQRKRLGRFWDFTSQKELGSAKHLLKPVQMHAGQSQNVLCKAVITPGLQIDILQVSGLLVIKYFADKKLDCMIKVFFFIATMLRSLF